MHNHVAHASHRNYRVRRLRTAALSKAILSDAEDDVPGDGDGLGRVMERGA